MTNRREFLKGSASTVAVMAATPAVAITAQPSLKWFAVADMGDEDGRLRAIRAETLEQARQLFAEQEDYQIRHFGECEQCERKLSNVHDTQCTCGADLTLAHKYVEGWHVPDWDKNGDNYPTSVQFYEEGFAALCHDCDEYFAKPYNREDKAVVTEDLMLCEHCAMERGVVSNTCDHQKLVTADA